MNLKLGCGQSLPYDMSGGSSEYVMGVLAYYEEPYPPMSGRLESNSGFNGKVLQNSTTYTDFKNNPSISFPNTKYYDLFKVGTTKETMPTSPNLSDSVKACNGGVCYGQALSETSGWYGDFNGFVYREATWSLRGGLSLSHNMAGLFYSASEIGSAVNYRTARFVLAP